MAGVACNLASCLGLRTMPALLIVGLAALISYLIGAVPFGFLIARWRGVDIFHQGSGNIGATNVGRVLGRRFGLLVFALDFAKGALPVFAARWVTGRLSADLPNNTLEVAAGLSAFLGHLFPVYLRFHGGKGVATGAGVIAVLLPGPALVAFLTWITLLILGRYVSLASLGAALALCVARLAWTPEPFAPDARILTVFCFVAAGLVFLRHRANIERLVGGTENRLRETAAMLALVRVLHLLALGLWFGSVLFFSLVATPIIFDSFGALAGKPREGVPAWLPTPLTKEQGTQLAGLAVGPIFPWYYLLQAVCGVVAVATAFGWYHAESEGIHRLRFFVLLAALASLAVGWPLAEKVGALRAARYAADSAQAAQATADFVRWHLWSLLVNFVTLLLVAVGMTLAAWLPQPAAEPRPGADGVPRPDVKLQEAAPHV
jgi:acyl phosphate:glycerol-3-phosphate acyltransferase